MKLMGCFGFLAFACLATLGLWFLEGYTISKFWTWFITPTFEIRTPGIWTCVGLAILVGLLTNHQWSKSLKEQLENDDDSETSMKKSIVLIAATVARLLLVLLSGWVVHCIGG